jgi:hypothetical protein
MFKYTNSVLEYSRIVSESEKSWEKREVFYFGWNKNIVVLEGTQASLICHSDNSSTNVKMLEWIEIAAYISVSFIKENNRCENHKKR